MRTTPLRIGCASGFYGDSQLAARQLVERGALDFLVFDYLAEVTMGILARAKAKDPSQGYARDFVTVAMADVLADCAARGIRVVANAGGVNVPACVAALQQLCAEQNLDLTIAGVSGDDLSARLPELAAEGLPDMETGQPLPARPISINAYLGAQPIAAALAAGADVVVTGRVVDSAVVIGPLLQAFGWSADDYDRLAQAALAGHILECGAQCTGGNFTDWHTVDDFATIGYPIAEVQPDGVFDVSIPAQTGGRVTVGSVGEQILYEIGDPANYLLPDVACDFTAVELTDQGDNRVRVAGARGRAPGTQYKVCATWVDGMALKGSVFYGGPRAAEKARTALDAWVRRCRAVFADRGWGDFREVYHEIIGTEATYGPHARVGAVREVMAKYGLHHDHPQALAFAASELAYLATSGPPGMSGLMGGRPRPMPMVRVHSALLDKSRVPVRVQRGAEVIAETCYPGTPSAPVAARHAAFPSPDDDADVVAVPLETLAFARSGDKGNSVNIGVLARESAYLPYIADQLTAEVVAGYFAHVVRGTVTRYVLPGLGAFNFLLTEALGGGGSATLRIDAQGKAWAQMLLSFEVRVPRRVLDDFAD